MLKKIINGFISFCLIAVIGLSLGLSSPNVAEAGWKTKGVIFLGVWGVKKAITSSIIRGQAVSHAAKHPEFRGELIKSINDFIANKATTKAQSVQAKAYLQQVEAAIAKAGKKQSSLPEVRAGPSVGEAAKLKSKEISDKTIQKVNGRKPINSDYAGRTHPSGIKFKDNGFPDFSPHAIETVKLKNLTGKPGDFSRANKALGLQRTPKGYTWHHVEDGMTMELVETVVHQSARHTGGAAILKGSK